MIDADSIVYASSCTIQQGDPVGYALGNVKSTMNYILDSFPDREYYKVFINGVGNFRDTLGTIKVYKDNRKDMVKPEHLEACREYLVNTWGAEKVDGREADDAVGCWQWAHKDKSTCIVGIDKDLNQIPGYHYNYRKQHFYYVTKHQGDMFFWLQMLLGDTVDNIPGIKGVGPKACEKIIQEVGGDLTKLRERVETLYKKQYGEDMWQASLDEVANLLYIQREDGAKWTSHL